MLENVAEPPPISGEAYSQIRDLMYGRFGISLGPGKKDLVMGRLSERVRRTGAHSFGDYLRLVMGDASGQELAHMVDALTTNFTSFFREREHFEFLERCVAPEWKSRTHMSVWSAGCATGEEPYTL